MHFKRPQQSGLRWPDVTTRSGNFIRSASVPRPLSPLPFFISQQMWPSFVLVVVVHAVCTCASYPLPPPLSVLSSSISGPRAHRVLPRYFSHFANNSPKLGPVSYSEHRFPAPSSKGCRKPVLGVWSSLWVGSSDDRTKDIDAVHVSDSETLEF